MALSSTYRWIMLGNLIVRNHKNTPEAPLFAISEVISASTERIKNNDQHQEYGKDKSRLMWLSDLNENDQYYQFLAHSGDKHTTGSSYIDFDTRKSRDIKKKDNEGGHYSAHIIIQKAANSHGNHLILVEKVPGIHLSALKSHFGWICKDNRFKKTYKDKDGKDKTCSPVFEIDGYQSNTIREALKTGKLQDIEFIRNEENFEDGLDEEPIIKEIVHHATWDIKRKVSEDEAKSLFKKVPDFIKNFKGDSNNTKTYVRIKTGAGQIKRTEIEVKTDEILEQAFIQNEIVNEFEKILEQRHDGLRQDMLEKMIKIAVGISS